MTANPMIASLVDASVRAEDTGAPRAVRGKGGDSRCDGPLLVAARVCHLPRRHRHQRRYAWVVRFRPAVTSGNDRMAMSLRVAIMVAGFPLAAPSALEPPPEPDRGRRRQQQDEDSVVTGQVVVDQHCDQRGVGMRVWTLHGFAWRRHPSPTRPKALAILVSAGHDSCLRLADPGEARRRLAPAPVELVAQRRGRVEGPAEAMKRAAPTAGPPRCPTSSVDGESPAVATLGRRRRQSGLTIGL